MAPYPNWLRNSLLTGCALALPALAAVVPAGTQLQVRLKIKIASNTSKPDDPVETTVIAPVMVNGALAIPAGVTLRGLVTGASAATDPAGTTAASAGNASAQPVSKLFLSQFGYGAIYVLNTDFQVGAGVQLDDGYFEARHDHAVFGVPARNPIAREQRSVELLPENGVILEDPLRIPLGHRRAGVVLPIGSRGGYIHAAHDKGNIRRVREAEIDHRQGAVVVYPHGAHLQDGALQLDVRAALQIQNAGDGDQDYDQPDAEGQQKLFAQDRGTIAWLIPGHIGR